ncbi:hypothetical protein [Engelhardtia mirabilis]|uniref:Uncharacterized protein n=1 Tax=Engelhardtia mirabilis TaxID=2528011 RepID=A0A518BL29_9BACT|nr:hypothetical protein Pla133_27670 [Planctomycetes bacterium Pla133]QDV02005.1 hypothetical protein Pla86_27660 [Planctomycetes bacterium Pla86]
MTQLGLFAPLVHPDTDKGATIEERFRAFDAANPSLRAELLRRARALRDRGVTRFGVKAIWEAIRYDASVSVYGAGTYRLNNSFTALYGRLLVELDPSLEGVIETRRRRGEVAA